MNNQQAGSPQAPGPSGNARWDRILWRVLDQMSEPEKDVLRGYLDRWRGNNAEPPTAAERVVMRRIDALMKADPEAQLPDRLMVSTPAA